MTSRSSGSESLETLGLELGSLGLHPAVFLYHGGSLCRMTVVSWGPEGEVKVSTRKEMRLDQMEMLNLEWACVGGGL